MSIVVVVEVDATKVAVVEVNVVVAKVMMGVMVVIWLQLFMVGIKALTGNVLRLLCVYSWIFRSMVVLKVNSQTPHIYTHSVSVAKVIVVVAEVIVEVIEAMLEGTVAMRPRSFSVSSEASLGGTSSSLWVHV